MAFAANALPALIAYIDTSERYVWVNDAYGRWFGRAREEILGRHAAEVLGPVAWTIVKPYAERALAGEEVAFDNTVVLEHGGTRDVRASYVPHRDDGGRISGFVALVTDITETKAIERALRRSERLLKRSQEAVQHLLRLAGHEVSLAHDGPAALAAAAATPPALVLLDIGLPGMDGYAVAAQLRATGHGRTALVALTGYGREDDIRRSRDAGFDHHLVKPIDVTHLWRIVLEVSGRRS